MTTPAGGELVGSAEIRVDADTDPAARALAQFSRDAQGRIRDVRGRFIAGGAAINQSLTDAAGGGDRLSGALGRLGAAARSVVPAAAAVGRIGLAAGAAVPAVAGLAAALAQMAPAAGVAATGIVAVSLAAGAVKVGMSGVQEATAAAFDPENPEKYAEALKKLSPNARAFVEQLRSMRPALDALKRDVQDRLFAGLDDVLKGMASSTLPVLRSGLSNAAGAMNLMAQGVGNAAIGLAKSGTLGQAISSANIGLFNLSRAPGQLVTALTQVAAAAGPSFERLTASAGGALDRLSDRVTRAFETGAIERAIETAIGLVKDLGTVLGNVGSIFGSVFRAAQVSGGGFLGTLKEISGSLAEAFASGPVQSALKALFQTVSTFAKTAGPLLGQALAAIAPVFTALGPPVQRLITSLGAALSPVIAALGPVLAATAGAAGVLVDAVSPLLPVVGQLVAALLPPLVPLVQAAGEIIRQAAPVVQQLAQALAGALAPILAQLPALVQPIAAVLTQLTAAVLPVLSRLLVALTPALAQIGTAFGQLLAAAGPLIGILGQLAVGALAQLLPLLTPITALVGRLASVLAGQLASTINNVVVPAFRLVTALLRGDVSGAWDAFKRLISGVGRHVATTVANMGRVVGSILGTVVALMRRLPGRLFAALATLAGGLGRIAVRALSRFRTAVVAGGTAALRWLRGLPGRASAALSSLAGRLRSRAATAGAALVSAIRGKVRDAVAAVRGLPGRARSALGDLGGRLAGAGRDLVRGMISGIRSTAGDLVDAAVDAVGGAVSAAKKALGISSPSRVFAGIGRDTGRGFVKGLTGTKAEIDRTADKVARSITNAFRGTGSRLDNRLVDRIQRTNRRLQRLSVERDRIAKRIADARKFATDLTSRARGTASLGSIVQPDFFAPRFVEARMRSALSSIKRFTANVAKLRKQGLNRETLRQILELGPTQGGGFAASLAAAGKSTIKRFNALQSSISKASTKLGRTGADALFDAGRKASRGFLTGLKAQEKQIEALMLRIARRMQRAIRRALGIRSPSRVMAEVGQLSGLGLAGGLAGSVPMVDRAMGRLAGAVADGVPARLPALSGPAAALPVGAMRTGHGASVVNNYITINMPNNGVMGSAREMENWMVRTMDKLRLQKRLPGA